MITHQLPYFGIYRTSYVRRTVHGALLSVQSDSRCDKCSRSVPKLHIFSRPRYWYRRTVLRPSVVVVCDVMYCG